MFEISYMKSTLHELETGTFALSVDIILHMFQKHKHVQ